MIAYLDWRSARAQWFRIDARAQPHRVVKGVARPCPECAVCVATQLKGCVIERRERVTRVGGEAEGEMRLDSRSRFSDGKGSEERHLRSEMDAEPRSSGCISIKQERRQIAPEFPEDRPGRGLCPGLPVVSRRLARLLAICASDEEGTLRADGPVSGCERRARIEHRRAHLGGASPHSV